MHCDWANITVPAESSEHAFNDIAYLLSTVGAVASTSINGCTLYKCATGGTFQRRDKRGFTAFGASGDFLAQLRGHDLLTEYVSIFFGLPHRTTKIDIAHDVYTAAPPVLDSVYKRALAGDVSLTRKALKSHQIRRLVGPAANGGDTGTVYLGTRKSEVSCKVYDKSQERWDKGYESPPDITRFELSITSKVGASLRDILTPEPAFWHYMGSLLPVPAGMAAWEPVPVGYSLPPRQELLPAELLNRRVENSNEIDLLLRLAARMGQGGLTYLQRQISNRYASLVATAPGLKPD